MRRCAKYVIGCALCVNAIISFGGCKSSSGSNQAPSANGTAPAPRGNGDETCLFGFGLDDCSKCGPGFDMDGGNCFGRLSQPDIPPMWSVKGAAVGVYNNIYLADTQGNRVLKYDITSKTAKVIAGGETAGSSGDTVALHSPTGIAVDGSGNVYVSDTGNSRVRMIAAGTGLISTIADNGTIPKNGGEAVFYPVGIAVDSERGTIYVVNKSSSGILKLTRNSDPSPNASDLGSRDSGYSIAKIEAGLSSPTGIAVAGGGTVYVADSGNNRIRKIAYNRDGTVAVSTVATGLTVLSSPEYVAADDNGVLYIANRADDAILRVTAAQQISTVKVNKPQVLAVNGAGFIIVAAGLPAGEASYELQFIAQPAFTFCCAFHDGPNYYADAYWMTDEQNCLAKQEGVIVTSAMCPETACCAWSYQSDLCSGKPPEPGRHIRVDLRNDFACQVPKSCGTHCAMFVTQGTTPSEDGTFDGNIGGIAGADAICSNEAKGNNWLGTFKAMISDGETRIACQSPNCDTNAPGAPKGWVLTPGTNYYDIRVGQSSIVATANSSGLLNSLSGLMSAKYWTGLALDWQASADNCVKWTSSGNDKKTGAFGSDVSGSHVSLEGWDNCGAKYHLVCVAQ